MELMNTTLTLSANINCPFWDLYDRDADDVILLINFYIAKEPETETELEKRKSDVNINSKETRIRVNDKTATNGWF